VDLNLTIRIENIHEIDPQPSATAAAAAAAAAAATVMSHSSQLLATPYKI